MPFDGTEANLRNLAGILRDQTKWPTYFQWDYTRPATCAIGLSQVLWGSNVLDAMSPEANNLIAHRLGIILRLPMHDVKPRYVADAIDTYLTFGEVDATTLKHRVKLTFGDRFRRWW